MKNLLIKHDIVKTGHFKLTSGRHSGQYINKDAIFCIPQLYSGVYYALARGIRPYYESINIVTGPAIAGAILAQPIAALLDNRIFVYPEKVDGEMVFRRGYDKVITANPFVWLVEDIITTGSSVDKTIEAVEDCGGTVVGVSAIWNRGDYEPQVEYFFTLIDEKVESFWPEECPLCESGEPLQDPKEKL